jgi:LysM repeat protein
MALGGSPMPTQQLPTFSVASTNLPTFPAFTTGTTNPVTGGTPWSTSTPGKPLTYSVHEGEFCYCLARRFNVNPDTLMSLNTACSSAALQPGTSISIPATGSWPGNRALKPHPVAYTVRSGDTIYTIACAFGDVDPNVIIAANGLVSPYTLTVGKTLQIP